MKYFISFGEMRSKANSNKSSGGCQQFAMQFKHCEPQHSVAVYPCWVAIHFQKRKKKSHRKTIEEPWNIGKSTRRTKISTKYAQANEMSGEAVAWFTINSNQRRYHPNAERMSCCCCRCYCRIETWFTHVYWLLTLGDDLCVARHLRLFGWGESQQHTRMRS